MTLACIASSYQSLYNELTAGTVPTVQQLEIAAQAMDPHYREDVYRRAEEHGVELFARDSHAFHRSNWPHPTDWSRRYLRPNKEMYHNGCAPKTPAELLNEPDCHGMDWEEYYHPSGDPLSLEMNVNMGEWMCFISATDEARLEAAKRVTGKSLIGIRKGAYLYSSYEDKERRLTPAPKPTHPKDFEYDSY